MADISQQYCSGCRSYHALAQFGTRPKGQPYKTCTNCRQKRTRAPLGEIDPNVRGDQPPGRPAKRQRRNPLAQETVGPPEPVLQHAPPPVANPALETVGAPEPAVQRAPEPVVQRAPEPVVQHAPPVQADPAPAVQAEVPPHRRFYAYLPPDGICRAETHDLGSMTTACRHCGALFWAAERPTSDPDLTACCAKGDISLPSFTDLPPFLQTLLRGNGQRSTRFRKNLRQYNSAFAFTSVVCNTTDRGATGQGPMDFQICGTLFHLAGKCDGLSYRRPTNTPRRPSPRGAGRDPAVRPALLL